MTSASSGQLPTNNNLAQMLKKKADEQLKAAQ